MKKDRKKIESIIREDGRKHTPEVIDSIDFHEHMAPAPEKRPFFRRRLPYAFAGVLSIVLIALLVVLAPEEVPGDPGNGRQPRQTIELSTREELYSLTALSAVSLLDASLANNNVAQSGVPRAMPLSQNGTPLIESYMPFINGYMNMLEPIMMGRETMGFTVDMSPLEEYTFRIFFSGTAPDGEPYSHVLHYNETEISSDEFIIEGIMIKNNVTYQLEGEIELDDDEMEMWMKATHPNETDTYLEIEQEITDDEQSFAYTFVKHGDTVFESSMEIEFDDDEVVAEIEHETNDVEIELIFVRSLQNNASFFIIEYEIETEHEDEEGLIAVNLHQEEGHHYYLYTIEIDDGPTLSIMKPRFHGQ